MKYFALLITVLLLLNSTSNAQSVFHKRYGSSYFDRAYRTIQTADQNFIVVGLSEGFGSGGNAFMMKVDTEGSIIWVKDYSGINQDQIRDIIELPDGSLVMCGATFSYGEGNQDGFIMKTDAEGNVLWAKSYGNIYGQYFLRIAEDGEDGFYVAGYVQKPPPNNQQGTAVMRVDEVGNLQWVRWSPNWSAQGDWWPIDMTPIASGGVVVAGVGLDIWKFDPEGNQEWSERYRPSGNGGVTGLSILENSDGQILLNFMLVDDNTVAQSGDNCILRLDSLGAFVSHKCYGEVYIEWSRTIANTSDGGTIICGFTNSAGNGDFDASLTKLDDAGGVEWAKAYGGAWEDNSATAIQTADGGYILTGQTWSQGSMADSSKIHLVKTDALGNSSCNSVSWSPEVNDIIAPSETPNTMSNFTSLVVSDIDWNPNDRTFYENDLCTLLSLDQLTDNTSCELYPNPFSYIATIEIGKNVSNAEIVVFNSLGQIVRKVGSINGHQVAFERENLKAGIYYIRLIQSDQIIANSKAIIID